MSDARTRLPVRLLRGVAALGERVRGRAPLDEAALHEAALARAGGPTDFGNPGYRDGLRVLLDAYEKEARLTPFGRTMVRGQLTAILRARLEAVAAWKRQPTVLEAAVPAPIFVLGLPRTGTTALHQMLAQDPAHQVLEYWIAQSPRPRPPRESWPREPRFKQAAQELRLVYWMDPGLRAIHDLTPDGPEECRHLLGQCFSDDTFDSNATIPSYTAWYRERDMRPSYAWHRDVLRLVQSTAPARRWVLKYPAHMTHLEVLLETYPDARLVFTHRDPVRVLPSLLSLVANWRGIYEDDVDVPALARWQVAMWAERIEHALTVRDRLPVERSFDLAHREIVEDPLAALRRLYAHFELDWTPAVEQAVGAWRAAHPPGSHGGHRPRAEAFGLDPAAVADRFGAYVRRFELAE